ncbi:hypothetical protein TNCT_195601 [Trichonephila clavata]|uniref:Uncharacterized protein n=1 Tax=Trichonephila clavata TaxID=2740835 RepID=A0A8X6GX97_TRICU|nr:hypothetical protein TNCT_195601 [Trichonephila clavata]
MKSNLTSNAFKRFHPRSEANDPGRTGPHRESLFRAIEQDIIVSHQGVLSNETEGRSHHITPPPWWNIITPTGCHRQQFGQKDRARADMTIVCDINLPKHCLYLGLGLHLRNNKER